ncbi:MAG: TolC family protein [Verrucomicrobia bacterium]|nr:TolC family protein [Verrucomicrobiota bacterium]
MRLPRVSGLLLLGLLRLPLPAAEGGALTLEEALAAVERVSLTVLLSRESAVQALEAAHQQRAANLPNLSASLQQRRSQGVSIATVVVTSGRPANRFDALLSGSYALYNPSLRVLAEASRTGAEVARANLAAALQAVLADVAGGYFLNLRNLRRREVLDANIARTQALLGLARSQFTAGVATQIDVTRAEAQLALAEQARLQHDTVVLQSQLLLQRILDLPPGQPLQLAGFEVRRTPGTLQTLGAEGTVFERRAEHLAARLAVDQSRLNVRATERERWPALTLSGNYGVASPRFDDDGKQDQWAFGVGVAMPVFDGFRLSASRRSAQSRLRSQEARLHHLELQISAELRLAAQDATSRHAQVSVAEKGLGLAREELRLAQQRYQQGVADNREVVEAQNRLAQAEDNLVEAVHQYNLSRVELARARGDVRTILAERAP